MCPEKIGGGAVPGAVGGAGAGEGFGQTRAVPGPVSPQTFLLGRTRAGPSSWRRQVETRAGTWPRMDARFLAATITGMSEVTRILSAIEQGDPHAAGELLPLVYE